ncbi:MAG TPA: Lrp/AsnC ligand binding domain-containing protein [Nitrosopumilaceae archaeon]|nr:Lrp/AsnC ligand binding domain-containing protein [Nitrosopumilaceae archaeon]
MVTAFVMISCNTGQDEHVIDKLKTMIPVREIHSTVGVYDIVTKVEANTADELKNAITAKIQNLSNVRSTLLLMKSRSQHGQTSV